MLRILGLMWWSLSASGSGAGSSGNGKLRRSHGATVYKYHTTFSTDDENISIQSWLTNNKAHIDFRSKIQSPQSKHTQHRLSTGITLLSLTSCLVNFNARCQQTQRQRYHFTVLMKHQFMLKMFKFKHIINVENSPLHRLSYSPWNTVNHSTYPLFKGEVRRGAPCVLTGQQPVGVSGAGRVGVGGGVGTGWTHGWRHVAVVVQHGAVTRVRRRGLRGGRVGPTQQRSGSPIHRLVRPDGRHRSEFTSTAYDQTRVCVCVCVCVFVQCCADLLPLLLAGASAIQVQRERSWSSWAWWSTVKAASVRSSTCRHTEIY